MDVWETNTFTYKILAGDYWTNYISMGNHLIVVFVIAYIVSITLLLMLMMVLMTELIIKQIDINWLMAARIILLFLYQGLKIHTFWL